MAYGIFLRVSMTFIVNGRQNKYFLIQCTLRENIKITEGVLTPLHVAIFIELSYLEKEWEYLRSQ